MLIEFFIAQQEHKKEIFPKKTEIDLTSPTPPEKRASIISDIKNSLKQLHNILFPIVLTKCQMDGKTREEKRNEWKTCDSVKTTDCVKSTIAIILSVFLLPHSFALSVLIPIHLYLSIYIAVLLLGLADKGKNDLTK